MDFLISRQEIRRQVLAMSSQANDALLHAQAISQLNAQIDFAAQRVAQYSSWLTLRRQAILPVGKHQTSVSYADLERARWMYERYPNDYRPATYGSEYDSWQPDAVDLASATFAPVGPAGFLAAAVWDNRNGRQERYVPLIRRSITPEMSQERFLAAGAEVYVTDVYNGESSTTIADNQSIASGKLDDASGLLQIVDPQADGIHLWPLPDQRYVILVNYLASPTWSAYNQQIPTSQIDQQLSIVDGIAIIHFTLANVFALQLDDFNSKRHEALGMQRMTELRGKQATGERIQMNSDITFNDYDEEQNMVLPRWQTQVVR